ncbi:hypothetical protein Tco_0831762 [Tanacetum coccineum]
MTRYRTTPEGLALNRTKPSSDDKHVSDDRIKLRSLGKQKGVSFMRGDSAANALDVNLGIFVKLEDEL